MLAASPLRSSNGDARDVDAADFCGGIDEATPALAEINFDELFMGFDDADMLPDLEVDPSEIFADFSADTSVMEVSHALCGEQDKKPPTSAVAEEEEEEEKEVMSTEKKDNNREVTSAAPKPSSPSPEGERGRKPSPLRPKGAQGKRKVKVDWTPELHRRFVQAVEQLGVDKAVPSRILELMGIDCLTRHNIASHLQKYRSHRKHMLAREAEAASWSQRRQMYAEGGGGNGVAKREMSPWLAPTIGFPPPPFQPFRPLHVWGHPTVDQPMLPVWPRHLVPPPCSPAPPPTWVPQLPLQPTLSWGSKEGWIPSAMTHGTSCLPQPMRFAAAPVSGIVPHHLYRPPKAVPPVSKQPSSQIQLDAHPSNESIDAAIGDVLTKPCLPLPLGLKPPSVDTVLVELQRQGISKIPTICS